MDTLLNYFLCSTDLPRFLGNDLSLKKILRGNQEHVIFFISNYCLKLIILSSKYMYDQKWFKVALRTYKQSRSPFFTHFKQT